MEKIKELLVSTTAHGIPKIVQSKNIIIKLMWIICTILSICACAYFLFKSLTNYFNYEVVTNINIYREEKSDFPTVSFCIESPKENILDKILFDCRFNQLKCSSSDFEFYLSELTNETCYRFNSGKDKDNQIIPIKKTSRTDMKTGLNLFIFHDHFYNEEFYKASLFIHNSSSHFTRDQSYNIESGIILPAGLSLVTINRVFSEQLSSPYNECIKQNSNIFKSEHYHYFIEQNMTYLQKDCIDICVEEFMGKSCNCTGESCFNNTESEECINSIYNEFQVDNISIPKSCYLDCPLECDTINYNIQSNYVGVPPDEFIANELIKNSNETVTIEEVKKNGIFISVYYSSLDYTLIKQIPKTELFDIVSNVGGMFGLFIGK